MWIVMTSSAKMPNNCWGRYRNVALVKIDQEYTARDYVPRMISRRARGVLRVQHMGHHNVGLTERSAYYVALREAERRAIELNNSAPAMEAALITTWGGSA